MFKVFDGLFSDPSESIINKLYVWSFERLGQPRVQH